MQTEPHISLFEMVSCLSSALDLVSPVVGNHQKRTAFIATSLAQELDLPPSRRTGLLMAGILHDCGAMSLQTKLDALRFDFDSENPHDHSEVGAIFLGKFEALFQDVARLNLSDLVRHHHVGWEDGKGEEFRGNPVHFDSHILHLADRVEVLIDRGQEILGQVDRISGHIQGQTGKLFMPQQVEAFLALAQRESFWLTLQFGEHLQEELARQAASSPLVHLDLDGITKLSQVFAEVVDFRSRFTATHSSGVSAVARTLAGLAGFSQREVQLISVAGYLHDLGKLAVPKEILEKKGPLNQAEFNIMKAHPYHAYHLLSPLKQLDMVVPWAAFHHETLDGSGYPFHHDRETLSLGSRIVTVSDIFTAITEDRPYRAGLPLDETIAILETSAKEGRLDPLVVSLVSDYRELINHQRHKVQENGISNYLELEI